MAYSRIIKLYEANGSTPVIDDVWCPAGVLAGVHQDAWCVLGARKGCRGGEIALGGTVRDAWRLSAGQVVKFFYDEDTVVWAGRVGTPRRGVDDDQHVYALNGAWNDVDGVRIDQDALVLGAQDGPAGTGTPEGIIQYLLDHYICEQTIITYEAEALAASGVSVDRFLVTRDQEMGQVIEQLEILASSGGGYWVAGVDADFKFYFNAVDQGESAVQVSYEIGASIYAGEERKERRSVANNLVVRGGVIPERGHVARWEFEHAQSIAAYGRSKRREIYTPGIALKSDQERMAQGYFEKWAQPPDFDIGGMVRVRSEAVAVQPWRGTLEYRDWQRGILGRSVISTVKIGFDEEFELSATSGPEERQGSYYDPSPTHDDAAAEGAGMGPPDLPMPYVTDQDDPSFEPFGGSAAGEGSVVPRGAATYLRWTGGALWYSPGASTQLAIAAGAAISNGGETLGESAVRFWVRFLDSAYGLISAGYHTGQRVVSGTGMEYWVDAAGFAIPASGYAQVAVQVITDEQSGASVWTPGGAGSLDWSTVPVDVIVSREALDTDNKFVNVFGYYG